MNKKIKRIYGQELENQPHATDEVRNTYQAMRDAIEAYIEAIEEYAFAWGYETTKKEGGVKDAKSKTRYTGAGR